MKLNVVNSYHRCFFYKDETFFEKVDHVDTANWLLDFLITSLVPKDLPIKVIYHPFTCVDESKFPNDEIPEKLEDILEYEE